MSSQSFNNPLPSAARNTREFSSHRSARLRLLFGGQHSFPPNVGFVDDGWQWMGGGRKAADVLGF